MTDTIKTWQERSINNAGWFDTKKAMQAEIDELRAALAQQAEQAPKTLTDAHLKAAIICREAGYISVSMVQRKLVSSYDRAQEICQEIINAGLVKGLKIAPMLTTPAAPKGVV